MSAFNPRNWCRTKPSEKEKRRQPKGASKALASFSNFEDDLIIKHLSDSEIIALAHYIMSPEQSKLSFGLETERSIIAHFRIENRARKIQFKINVQIKPNVKEVFLRSLRLTISGDQAFEKIARLVDHLDIKEKLSIVCSDYLCNFFENQIIPDSHEAWWDKLKKHEYPISISETITGEGYIALVCCKSNLIVSYYNETQLISVKAVLHFDILVFDTREFVSLISQPVKADSESE